MAAKVRELGMGNGETAEAQSDCGVRPTRRSSLPFATPFPPVLCLDCPFLRDQVIDFGGVEGVLGVANFRCS